MIHSVHGRETKPIWSSSTFLVYTGGLTVLLGAIAALLYLATQYGSGAEAGWAALILVILYAVAHTLKRRDRPMAAGIFAFVSVIAWAAFLFVLFEWWGWNGVHGLVTRDIHHWSWSRLLAEILILAAAWDDRRRFRFPFIRLISAVVFWLFLLDLLRATGGNWAPALTLILGLVYLLIGNVADRPSAFWLHFVGGALVLGAIFDWCHTTDSDFAVISIVSTVFVLIAYWTRRSSWAFYGAVGFFAATIHYVIGSPTALLGGVTQSCVSGSPGMRLVCTGTTISPWSPALAFGLLGFWLVLLGLLGRRRRAVTAPAPPPAPPAD